jgi:hypothetical protein
MNGASADGKALDLREEAMSSARIHRAYDLDGCMVGVFSNDRAATTFLDPILAPLSCDPPTVCDWEVSLTGVDAIEMPQSGSRVFDGSLPEGLPATIVEHERLRTLVVPGYCAIALDRAARTVELRFVKDQAAAIGGTASFWMLADILAASAQYLLHGAGVIDPRSGDAIALFAPSGTGKTTTVLALARSGFHLASDDALVLSVRRQMSTIWGIPRHVKISRQTAAMLPWLAPCLAETWIDGEQTVARDALAALVTLANPQPRRVGRVIVLRPPNDRDHLLMPMAKPDAVTAIARDNFRVTADGIASDTSAAFAALSTLIATTPVIALSPGPDPETLATRLFRLS